MITLEATQKVPLTLWDDGSIRVKSTRLLVDMVIDAHNRGQCPEEIFDSFPSKLYTVADIYSIIAYYLTNKKKIDRYMAKREKEAESLWKVIEADPRSQEQRRQLQKRAAEFRKSRRA